MINKLNIFSHLKKAEWITGYRRRRFLQITQRMTALKQWINSCQLYALAPVHMPDDYHIKQEKHRG